eukprot:10895960-Karenia_brevis.AAC.1
MDALPFCFRCMSSHHRDALQLWQLVFFKACPSAGRMPQHLQNEAAVSLPAHLPGECRSSCELKVRKVQA